MKKTKVMMLGLVVALGALGTVTISRALAEDKVYSLDQLPPAVQATITRHAGQTPIAKIQRDVADGTTVYEVEQQIDGQKVEFLVAASGKYLGPEAEEADERDEADEENSEGQSEQPVTWEQLPKPVQDALTTILGSTTPDRITREVDHGFTLYEAEYTANGMPYSVKLSDSGDTLEKEERIDVSALPVGVVKQLAHLGQSREVKAIERVTVTFYEVEVKSRRRTEEVRMFPNGQRLNLDGD